MENIRPYLVKLAEEIVTEHLNTGQDLSSLVAQRSKSASLNLNTAKLLVGLTNKEYINRTGQMEFELANPYNMTDHYFNEINTSQKTASINNNYPHYNNLIINSNRSINCGTSLIEKTASVLEQKREITPHINYFYKTKQANLDEQMAYCYSKMEEAFDSAKSIINTLHKYAHTKEDICNELFKYRDISANDIELINKMYPGDILYKDASVKLLSNFDEEFQELSDSLLTLENYGREFLRLEEEKAYLNSDIETFNKAGKIYA